MSTKTTNTVIAAGLRADIMRKRMETKNTLVTKGDIYVGLGTQDSDSNYQTGALGVGTNNYVLMCDSSESLGLKYGQIVTASISDLAVTTAKIATKAVTTAKIADGAITSTQLDSYSVTGLKIANGAIISTKLASGSVITDKIADSNVTNAKLANSSVTIGSTSVALGRSITTITGLSSVTSTSFITNSDKRLKENITPFEYKKSILDLPIKKFDFIDGPKNQIGCLAQDLQELYPELVTEDHNGYLTINESKLIYLLMEEIKQIKAQIAK